MHLLEEVNVCALCVRAFLLCSFSFLAFVYEGDMIVSLFCWNAQCTCMCGIPFMRMDVACSEHHDEHMFTSRVHAFDEHMFTSF